MVDLDDTDDGSDPIHFANGKWWFWDETGTDQIGPYDDEIDARVALDRYVRQFLGD